MDDTLNPENLLRTNVLLVLHVFVHLVFEMT